MNRKNEPFILDCTFRDGGYYNQWDFEEDLVKKYLRLLSLSNVDGIEIGYRFFKSSDYFGPFAYSTEKFLDDLNIDKKIAVAVMINASEIIRSKQKLEEFKKSFIKASHSRVDIVRVASNMNEASATKDIVEYLKNQGYIVCINLMKISESLHSDIEMTVKEINGWSNKADVLYIADSFGNLDAEKTKELIEMTSSFWDNQIGFHAHNNQGKALTNTIAALRSNASWLDSTIQGMGRGAGNAATESLMMELNEESDTNEYRYDPKAIFPLVVEEFEQLKREHGWGHSLLYEVSSRFSVHPTYIQEILYKKDKYSTDQILRSLDTLVKTNSTSYSKEIAESLLVNDEVVKGDWDASGWLENKDILVLGSGKEAYRNSKQIEEFIDRKKPVTLSLNINHSVNESLIDAYIIVNRIRFVTELNKSFPKDKKIILPFHTLSSDMKSLVDPNQILNYGCNISSGNFKTESNHCVIPYELAIAYALAVISIGRAKNIFLAGFDGFSIHDQRQNEMLDLFNLFNESNEANIPIISITKTNYPIMKRTLHDPSI